MKTQKVIIVGGGFGGVKTALELANKKGFEVLLLSCGGNFEYHGALYRSATGRSPMEVVVPIKDILKRAKNVTFELDTIDYIDPKRKTISGSRGRTYQYDKLILALGNKINYFGIEGMEQHSFSMNTIAHTVALRNALTRLFKDDSVTEPKIAIVGGGASGVELAGELQNFARMVANKYRKHVRHPKIVLIEGEDRVLHNLDPVLSAKAYKRLQKMGVQLMLSTKVNSCEQSKICLDKEDIDADIIVWTAGSSPVDFYTDHPKVFAMERGRVQVDEYLCAKGHEDMYILGDNANTKFSGMAQTALHDAKFVARNLVAEQKGKSLAKYRNWHPIYVIPVGRRWAILQTQKSKISGYRGWLVRRRADRWIFNNFLPYKKAIKQWRKGNRLADF